MKEYPIHYGYRIDNLKNGKFYYGIHSTDNLNDGYMGSGVYLKRAYSRSKADFRKTILVYFSSRQDAIAWEAKTVTEDLVKDRNCYNLTLGGRCVSTVETYQKWSVEYQGYGNPEFKSWKAFYEDRMDELAWLLQNTDIPDSFLVRKYRQYAPGSNKWKKSIKYLEHAKVLPAAIGQSIVNSLWIRQDALDANINTLGSTCKGVVTHYRDAREELHCILYKERLFEGALSEWKRFWESNKSDAFLVNGYSLGEAVTGFDISAMRRARDLWESCGAISNVRSVSFTFEVNGTTGRMAGKTYVRTGKKTMFDVDFSKIRATLLDEEFNVYEYDNDEGFVKKGRLVDRRDGPGQAL